MAQNSNPRIDLRNAERLEIQLEERDSKATDRTIGIVAVGGAIGLVIEGVSALMDDNSIAWLPPEAAELSPSQVRQAALDYAQAQISTANTPDAEVRHEKLEDARETLGRAEIIGTHDYIPPTTAAEMGGSAALGMFAALAAAKGASMVRNKLGYER